MGAGGGLTPPRSYWEKMQAVIRKYDMLFIADEVICGFGRTGNMWGSQTYDLQPDMISCAKALSAGMQPISALLINQRVFEAMLDESRKLGNFAHGFTYAGHPVTTAVAMETLRIYEEMDMLGHVQRVGPYLQEKLGSAGRSSSGGRWPPPAARRGSCRPGCGWTSSTRPSRPRPNGRTSSARRIYFLELMDHGLDIERRVRDGLTEIARKLRIPPVVTNDSHYTREADSQAQDMLLCIQTGKTLLDTDRLRFDGSGYYIKPAAEMYSLDSSDLWQEGCRNSQLLIADRVDTTGMFDFVNLMPRFPIPDDFESEDELFRAEVWKGMDRRYPDGYDEQRRQQAEYEIGIISQMGFPAYFLVVADFIMWAKNNGVAVGPGRGSAAGSIVAYAMGITDLDPLVHGLIFERFLNPERVSMPDIDIDFDERGRADVIRYVTQKWGSDRVAQIVTYGTIKAKAAIKDSCRVLGHPYALGDRITKAFPPAVMGKDVPLSAIFDENHARYKEAGELRSRPARPRPRSSRSSTPPAGSRG